MDRVEMLGKLGACEQARDWVGSFSQEEIRGFDLWRSCKRGDWLLWLAGQVLEDRRDIVGLVLSMTRPSLGLLFAGSPSHRLGSKALDLASRWCYDDYYDPSARARAEEQMKGAVAEFWAKDFEELDARLRRALQVVIQPATIATVTAPNPLTFTRPAYLLAFDNLIDGSPDAYYANLAKVVRRFIRWRDIRDGLGRKFGVLP